MTSIYSYLFTAFYDWLRDNEANPRIMVDATKPGVQVPQAYVTNGMILISVCHLYVREFKICESCISFYTSFRGKEEHVIIPYNAMMDLVCSNKDLSIPIYLWLSSINDACHMGEPDDFGSSDTGRATSSSTSESARTGSGRGRKSDAISFSLTPYNPEEDKLKSGANRNSKGAKDKVNPNFTMLD